MFLPPESTSESKHPAWVVDAVASSDEELVVVFNALVAANESHEWCLPFLAVYLCRKVGNGCGSHDSTKVIEVGLDSDEVARVWRFVLNCGTHRRLQFGNVR